MTTFMEALLNGWWQGIVLTFLVWVVLRDLRRVNAATKLVVWQITLVSVLLLPALQSIHLSSQSTPPAVNHKQQPAPAIPNAAAQQPDPTEAIPLPTNPNPVVKLSGAEAPLIMLSIALCLSAFQLLRLLVSYCALRRLKRRTLASGLDLPIPLSRSARVLLSEEIGMPMAAGYLRPAIILPRSLVTQLNPEDVRYVLLHETAHLQRYDDWLVLIERLVRAVFCFHPAVHWISRQIGRERELACDDWVTARSGATKPYAKSLARLAELGTTGRAPQLAMGAGRTKEIFVRLESLLDGARNRLPSVSAIFVALACVLLVLTIHQGARFRHVFGFSDFPNQWVASDGSHHQEIRMRGDVQFTADDTDVRSMAPDAMLVIEHSDEFRSWRMEFEPNAEGVVQRRYFSGGFQRPFDSAAQQVVSVAMAGWVREMGRDIPEHLSRSIQSKGVEGALEDIRSIHNDGVKRAYLQELPLQVSLTTGQWTQALKVAAGLNADADKRQFLEALFERGGTDVRNQEVHALDVPLLGLIGSIHNDSDRRQLLIHFMEHGPVTITAVTRLLRSASEISSDSARADVLLRVSETSAGDFPEVFFDVAATIHSANDLERLLSQVVALHGRRPGVLAHVLHTGALLSSDTEKAKLFAACAGSFPLDDNALAEASRFLALIQSENDRRGAVEALLDSDAGNPKVVEQVLLHASKFNADGDKSRLLVRVAALFTEDEPARRAFFSAVNTLHSSGEQRRVLLAVLARATLTRDSLRDVSEAALRIPSTTDQVAVLKAVTEKVVTG